METRMPRVGMFDSGFGGLTVLAECRRLLPRTDFFYFGDNANAPYGSRSGADISRLVRRGAEALLAAGAGVLVLACNTATAVCAEELRRELSVPVVGMEPAVRLAEGKGRAVVLATPRTASSERFARLLETSNLKEPFVFAPPALAAAVEKMLRCGTPVRLEEHLPQGVFGVAVLGCTHYIYLRREISAFYGCPTVDGNAGTAKRLLSLLGERGYEVEPKWSETAKTNKSLPCGWKEERPGKVFFLGESASLNKKIYERMFENT